MSAFSDWFEEQFGKRPRFILGSDSALEDELANLARRTGEIHRELVARTEWEKNRTAALYAWQAREKL